MRNIGKHNEPAPEFYRMEERDVELPKGSRLEVRVMDAEDMGFKDRLIGSTIIDLEDRWHSTEWRRKNDIQNLAVESRPLYNPDFPGVNKGAIDMWVEMLETAKSAEIKPSDLRPPPETILESRFVIWGAKDVKKMREEYSNVMISTSLDCKEYSGQYDPYQQTDEHYNCKDVAIFNWRMVYPKIRPTRSCTVQIDCWHYELLGNEFIGTLN